MRRRNRPIRRAAKGFTLIEAIVVIVITAILAGIVGLFIVRPVQGYFSSAVRAEMADVASNALERIGREVRLALPNSTRVDATGVALEFIPSTDGGRYRTEGTDRLDFTTADTTFDVLGPAVTIAAGQSVVFYNLGPGIVDSDAYVGNNRRLFSGAAGSASNVTITSSSAIPAANFAPPYRFHVVDQPVTYVCSGTTLTRYTGYGFQASISTSPGGTSSVIANNVSSCSFTYDTSVVATRAGLVTMRLSLTQTPAGGGAETVSLYHAVHVDNLP
jgi:MSHA biogenesis protein MshO